MTFDHQIGIFSNNCTFSNARETVKAIILKDNKILLNRSKLGDYSFPGGGIEALESHHEAISREIKEETGFICNSVGDYCGKVVMRRPDRFDISIMYELISYFYLCEISAVQGEQTLSKTEINHGLEPMWIDIEEALISTKQFHQDGKRVDYWYDQIIFILEWIVEYTTSRSSLRR